MVWCMWFIFFEEVFLLKFLLEEKIICLVGVFFVGVFLAGVGLGVGVCFLVFIVF